MIKRINKDIASTSYNGVFDDSAKSDKTGNNSTKYRPTFVGGPSKAIYSKPILFQSSEFENNKKQNRPLKRRVLQKKSSLSINGPSLSFRNLIVLSDWLQLIQIYKSTSIKRLEFFEFISSAGISLNSARIEDRNFIADCLKHHFENSTKNPQALQTPKVDDSNSNIFPLLDQATNIYFTYFNPYNPFFTYADFQSKPRSKFLRLCVWRIGLQLIPSSELLVDLSHNIEKQISSRLIPSALSFELGILQGLLILLQCLHNSQLNQYQLHMLHIAVILESHFGLHLVTPGPLNQERLLALLILRCAKAHASKFSNMAWYNHFPDFPLQNSTWPLKLYSNISDLYRDHPISQQANFFNNDYISATLDANITALCLCTYHFEKYKGCNKSRSGSKKNLQRALAWGTWELQRSKAIQLSSQQFVPLANYSEVASTGMLYNQPEANSIITQLQLILQTRFHHALLSTSDSRHTFFLVDLFRFFSGSWYICLRLDMLIDATRHLLLLPKDPKVEKYLKFVQSCLEKTQSFIQFRGFTSMYLGLFDALVARYRLKLSN